MSVVGPHPESGLRIEIERPREGGPPWTYDGFVVTPTDRFPLRARVEQDGTVAVELLTMGPEQVAPPGLLDRARLIIRTVYRHARDEAPQAAPPRRIVRWRP